jgi:hypothetical protein
MLIGRNLTGGCNMTRLIAAAPVFACDLNKSSSAETQSNTAASNAKPALHSRS